MTQRVIEILSPCFIQEDDLKTFAGWPAIFGNAHPVSLEVGCGTGDFIVALARQNPLRNFIAIDIYNKGCLKTCKKLDAAGLTNVRVLRMEARHLLYNFFAPSSLDAIYINCPDPWPKLRHRGRRLVQEAFIRMVLYFLRPGGDFYFATDFVDYGEEVAELFEGAEGYENRLHAPYSHALPGYPSSKYMDRFLQLGQSIYYVHQRKAAQFQATCALLEGDLGGFRLQQMRSWRRNQSEALEAAPCC